jgi:hypothetical protein
MVERNERVLTHLLFRHRESERVWSTTALSNLIRDMELPHPLLLAVKSSIV